MEKAKELIYLAALLHDIGKFYQRADTGAVKDSQYLSTACENEAEFCPSYQGRYSHKHVLWTAQFIQNHNASFNALAIADSEKLTESDSLLHLAAKHHLPSERLSEIGRIIKEADGLSAGMDRNVEPTPKEKYNWDDFKKKRMIPITATIKCDGKGLNAPADWQVPVKPLALTNDVFPQQRFEGAPDYKTLWEAFEAEFKKIQTTDCRVMSETLLSLLFKYATCIPASTVNFPDVSLYDHLKTTAALAVCLFDSYKEPKPSEAPFIVIGADISGIQPYIYQITSKYAGKNLKGRSFYLRLLSDAVVRYLLKELELFQGNVIYNSGGGFYILAPNTIKVKEKLKAATRKIEEQLFATHGTSLYVAIDYVPVSREALTHTGNEDLGKVWGALFEKYDRKKNQKFADIMTDNYAQFFEPAELGARKKVDVVTGETFSSNEKAYSVMELEPVKKTTKKQVELGKVLRDFHMMAISDGEIPAWEKIFHLMPLDLGLNYYFIQEKDVAQVNSTQIPSSAHVCFVTLNGTNGQCDFMGTSRRVSHLHTLDFYGGNELSGKDVPTFEDMCRRNEESAMERLGVLRMDVDNLGNIFQSGISHDKVTLSRMSSLSRSFDYFFSGYLNTIYRETNPEKSFIIYSGGDDLFLVGSWDIIIKLAKRVHQDFQAYTCHNPAFSISGGISIVKSKFPIIKGAEVSAEEESRAKNHECKGQNKNSISFISMPLNWDKEFDVVEHLKDLLVDYIDPDRKGVLPKSFISKILTHWATADIRNHKINNPKTFWMATYDLSRTMERTKDENAKALINRCKTEICGKGNTLNGQPIETEYHMLELWAFACRWAELEIRSGEE